MLYWVYILQGIFINDVSLIKYVNEEVVHKESTLPIGRYVWISKSKKRCFHVL